ncbi:MAG: ATP-binding cassette domain-containing protein [Actinomycetota bacterium]
MLHVVRGALDLAAFDALESAVDEAPGRGPRWRPSRPGWRRQSVAAAAPLAAGGLTVAGAVIGAVTAASAHRIGLPTVAVPPLMALGLGQVFVSVAAAAAGRAALAPAAGPIDRLDAATGDPHLTDPGHATAGALGEVLEFDDVSASYGSHVAVQHLSLRVEGGERVALVGPSGSGKSTAAAIAQRLVAVDSGSVLVDHRPIERYAGRDVRQVIGVVSADQALLAGTLGGNVRLARPDADDEETAAALTAAGLELPPQTVLGEGGNELSGGERQRVALAALALNRRIVILDRPTAGLDPAAGRALLDLLWATADQAVLVITHDLSVLDRFQRVVDLTADAETRAGASSWRERPTSTPTDGQLMGGIVVMSCVPANMSSYIVRTQAVTAGRAVSSIEPASNGGSGTYSMSSWVAWAYSTPTRRLDNSRAMSMPGRRRRPR